MTTTTRRLREARSDGYHLLEKERAQALKEKDEKVRAFKEETQQHGCSGTSDNSKSRSESSQGS